MLKLFIATVMELISAAFYRFALYLAITAYKLCPDEATLLRKVFMGDK